MCFAQLAQLERNGDGLHGRPHGLLDGDAAVGSLHRTLHLFPHPPDVGSLQLPHPQLGMVRILREQLLP